MLTVQFSDTQIMSGAAEHSQNDCTTAGKPLGTPCLCFCRPSRQRTDMHRRPLTPGASQVMLRARSHRLQHLRRRPRLRSQGSKVADLAQSAARRAVVKGKPAHRTVRDGQAGRPSYRYPYLPSRGTGRAANLLGLRSPKPAVANPSFRCATTAVRFLPPFNCAHRARASYLRRCASGGQSWE